MEPAPIFHDIADAATDGTAYWVTCDDGVRIRIGVWPISTKDANSSRGTVLLFPGRTEYIEKYGRASADLARRGYTTLVVDWRGQGLADRLTMDAATGHIGKFQDYQLDVRAAVAAADALELPKPYHLLAHSMGGCIGLRALHNGLPVNSAVFTGPMWGILIPRPKRYFAQILARLSTWFAFRHRRPPGTGPTTYVDEVPFEDNMLTTDADMFAYMKAQTDAHPELALGGPSLGWLDEALRECAVLMRMTAPQFPTLSFLGTNERIVEKQPIIQYHQNWPQAELIVVDGAEHETMMEIPPIRNRVFDDAVALFDRHK